MTDYNPLEEFSNGQTVRQFRASDEGYEEEHWESAAYQEEVENKGEAGVDRVGDTTEDLLVLVETEDSRSLPDDFELEGREYISNAVEYNVEVEVYDRDEELVDEGKATFISGSAEDTTGRFWADEAAAKALYDGSVDSVDSPASAGGEIEDLLNDEEPSGMDALDTV